LCVELRRALDPHGLVVDDRLRSRIVQAHADSGMPADAAVRIVLAPPASLERLSRLQTACRERFARDLPEDYVAFLGEHDGLRVGELSQDDGARVARDLQSFGDHAIMSSVLVYEWMQSLVANVTHPDGSTSRDVPSILPFYDLVETGCHAFDFSARGGVTPVVDVDGERVWDSGGHDPLAPSFAVWLDAFIRAGLEPFAAKSLLLGQ
jgi:hypothetical protein